MLGRAVGWCRVRWLTVGVIALFAGAVSAETPSGTASLPAGVSQDWWSAAQREIRNQEYYVTWQDSTRLPDLPAAYHAASRAQNLRTYFTPDGFRAVPRDVARDVALPWAGAMVGITFGGGGVQCY